MSNTKGLPPFPETVPITEVAKRYGLKVTNLKAQAVRGDFPRLFKVSTKDYRVLLADLLAWESGRWVPPCEKVTPDPEIPPSLRKRRRVE